MQLRLKMVDRSDYPIASLAMLLAWAFSNPMGLWLTLHPSLRWTMQALGTLALGIGTLTAQHFWRRYMNRRWPAEKA